MSDRNLASAQRQAGTRVGPAASGLLQRRCDCGSHTMGGECETCKSKGGLLQRASLSACQRGIAGEGAIAAIVHQVLRSSGQPLDAATRAFFEPRFAHDFSQVRVHTDAKAAQSARAVNALAYTVGRDIVFGGGQYAPATAGGGQLIAHELTHVVQQRSAGGRADAPLTLGDAGSVAEAEAAQAIADLAAGRMPRIAEYQSPQLARAPCTPAATCAPTGVPTPVLGSSEEFSQTEAAREAGPRARRKRMTPARAVATGHAGHARQLEHFLDTQQPGRLSIIQGIFIDADMSPGTDAFGQDCADWIAEALPAGAPTPPGMSGATKRCVFVPGHLNQEALAFNTTRDATIGGIPREEWRSNTLQILIHESEHPRYEAATAGHPPPAGVTSPGCTRANIETALTELAAVISEFPFIANAAAAEANLAGPRHAQMNSWFEQAVRTGGENISGNLLQMGCSCSCPEVAAFVRETFDNVTASCGWSVADKNAFNARMRTELPAAGHPAWPL